MYNLQLFLILSAEKKDAFDKYGENGLNQGAGAGYSFSSNPHEMFSQMFGGSVPFGNVFDIGSSYSGGDGFSGLFGGRAFEEMELHTKQDKEVNYDLYVTFEELFQGCTKKMKISRKVLSSCGSSKTEEKIIEVVVKPGWKEGTKIRYQKQGDQYPGRIPADIVFTIKEKPHNHFTRDGNNLKFTAKISLKDALCGLTATIPCIDKTVKTLDIKEIISPKFVWKLHGHGMPLSNKPGRCGDLVVNFDIQFPSILTAEDKKTLKSILS